MAEKKDNTVPIILGVFGIGLIVYGVTSSPQQNGYGVPVGPGQTLSGNGWSWQNNTGQNAIVTATGLIVNNLGDILGSISDIMDAASGLQNNNGGGGGAGGVTTGANVTGRRGVRGWLDGGLY